MAITLYTATLAPISLLPLTSTTPQNEGVFLINIIFPPFKDKFKLYLKKQSFPCLFYILYRWQGTLPPVLSLHLYTALKITKNLLLGM